MLDKLFDMLMYLCIFTSFIAGAAIAGVGVHLTIIQQQAQPMVMLSAAIMFGVAVLLSSFLLYIKSWSSDAK